MRLLALIVLAVSAGGCATVVPPRWGVGVTVDAESHEVKTWQLNAFYDTAPWLLGK